LAVNERSISFFGRLLLIVGGDRDRRLWGASCSSERRLPFVTALIRIPGRNPSAM
jgi:hypothetical protein